NKVHMLENSTYSVISPEGATALLWKDSGKARDAAEPMKITAPDLRELHVIDQIISERMGGANRDIETQALYIDQVLDGSLQELLHLTEEELLEQRWQKYSQIGDTSQ